MATIKITLTDVEYKQVQVHIHADPPLPDMQRWNTPAQQMLVEMFGRAGAYVEEIMFETDEDNWEEGE